MLEKRIDIDTVHKEINKLFLSERLLQADYSDLFYDHLTSMIKYRLLGSDANPGNVSPQLDEVKITEKVYHGLEQYIFEHSAVVEYESPKEIDWQLVDEGKEILTRKYKALLGTEGKSEHLRPIISFTADAFENWLIYKQLHPGSSSNPWLPAKAILNRGYIYLVSDKKELISEYQERVYKHTQSDQNGNIGVIAKSKKEKKFSGFLTDNRSNLQALVYEYLKREADGINNAKGNKQIAAFLLEQGYELTDNEIKNKITLPLKRSGLIGSLTTGFFHINSLVDLKKAYQHHIHKLQGIQRTLDIYTQMGKALFGTANLGDY